jgi:hypothetical protein
VHRRTHETKRRSNLDAPEPDDHDGPCRATARALAEETTVAMKKIYDRKARRAFLERVIQTDPCPEWRAYAARELGKIWAEEALEKINAKIAATT